MRRAILALLFGSALAISPAFSQQQPPAFEPRDETPEMYPDAPNREETFYFCIACHSFKIVAQQGLNRSRWDEVLTWMTERHKMPDIQGDDREKILDYLSSAFPERQQQRGWKNPFASQ
ncbi:MAG: hypothetical protein ACK4TL_15025 [Hyphomicrobiaceae bacterium]